jgi:hypothetical protein
MTEKATAQGLHGYRANRRKGVVKGFARSEFHPEPDVLVKVLRDGERSTREYHMDFWQPEVGAKINSES